VLLLACVLAAPALAQEPANQLDASPGLFTVMAAVNAAGFGLQTESPNNHPLRAWVDRQVAAKKPPSLARIRSFLEERKAEEPVAGFSFWVSFGLCLDVPSFQFKYPANQLPPDVHRLRGLEKLLKEFYEEAGLADVWKKAQGPIDESLAPIQSPIVEAVQQANLYLRMPTSGFPGKRFQIYYEPLAPPNYVLTRTYVDDYVVVLTPAPELRIADIRHAYLHYLIDPMALRHGDRLEKKRPISDLALASPILDDSFKTDFVLLAGMCLVKAAEARLAAPGRRAAAVETAMSEGFILTAYFYEALAAFEKDDRSLRLAIAEMIDGIDLAKEDKRIAQVQFAGQRTTRTVRAPRPAAPPPLTGVDKALAGAESLYEERNLGPAKDAFQKVLEMAAPTPVHARAYYGLARIALLEKNPELAFRTFERALTLDPEPAVKAWLHIYLARLSRAAQEPERAVEHYKAALAVDGASEMARTSAKKEMDALAQAK
jgi:hypothetical protein